MNKVFQIALHETRATARSKGAARLGGLILVASLFCLLTGYDRYIHTQNGRLEARKEMRKLFLAQGRVNPHSAAHYGHFVFKPNSFLTTIEPGVERFVGVTLQLEGHQQNDVQFAPSQKASSLIRLGELSFSLLLQVIFPLLIFFVVHQTVAQERQQGTLKLLVAQGVPLTQILWGKIAAYTAMSVAVLLACLLPLILLAGLNDAADVYLRAFILLCVYSTYYFLLIAITVLVSAAARSSASALVIMLCLWLATAIIVPKLAANLGEQAFALPSKLDFEKNIAEANRNGINGHDPRDQRSNRMKDSLLLHYKVDSLNDLPVNADGIIMQADEQYHNTVYDKQFALLRKSIEKQDLFTHIAAGIDPALAVQQISMGLSGTDIHHHFLFLDQAETYRRFLIKKLNDQMAYGGSKTGDWDWAVSPDYWKGIHDYQYIGPSAGWALSVYRTQLFCFLLWTILIIGLVQWIAPRIAIT